MTWLLVIAAMLSVPLIAWAIIVLVNRQDRRRHEREDEEDARWLAAELKRAAADGRPPRPIPSRPF